MKLIWNSSISRFSLYLLAFSLVFLGCACPRRKAETTHLVEVFTGREDGLIERETWKDAEGGGGFFLFADPAVQSLLAIHTNQSALGGESSFAAGTMTLMVDTNTANIIGAGGTAIGNILGATVKTIAK